MTTPCASGSNRLSITAKSGREVEQTLVAIDIESVDQLERVLVQVGGWGWFTPRRPLAFRLPTVASTELKTIEKRLNYLGQVCGCHVGAAFAVAGLAWYVLFAAESAQSPMRCIVLGAAVTVGAGIGGKAAALVFARVAFILNARLFLRRIRRREPKP